VHQAFYKKIYNIKNKSKINQNVNEKNSTKNKNNNNFNNNKNNNSNDGINNHNNNNKGSNNIGKYEEKSKKRGLFEKENSDSNIRILSFSEVLEEELERKAKNNKKVLKKSHSDNQFLLKMKLKHNDKIKSLKTKKNFSSNDLSYELRDQLKPKYQTKSIFDVNKYVESHTNEKKAPLNQSYSRLLNEYRQTQRTPQISTINNVYNNIYNISINDKHSNDNNELNDFNSTPNKKAILNKKCNEKDHILTTENNIKDDDDLDIEKNLLKKFDEHLELNLDHIENSDKIDNITVKKVKKKKKKNKKKIDKRKK